MTKSSVDQQILFENRKAHKAYMKDAPNRCVRLAIDKAFLDGTMSEDDYLNLNVGNGGVVLALAEKAGLSVSAYGADCGDGTTDLNVDETVRDLKHGRIKSVIVGNRSVDGNHVVAIKKEDQTLRVFDAGIYDSQTGRQSRVVSDAEAQELINRGQKTGLVYVARKAPRDEL